MKTTMMWRVAVVLMGLACTPVRAANSDAAWREDHDAGWKAFRATRLDEAERRLRSAEREARTFGENHPRLATTLDHHACVMAAKCQID